MDSNSDGDIGPREFLGSAEKFRQLVDQRGLSFLEEIDAFEASCRNGRQLGLYATIGHRPQCHCLGI